MLEPGKLTIGLNYWASDNATRMWKDFHPDVLEKDLALFEQYGVSLLRVFPLWPDFQPIRLLQYGTSAQGTLNREVCMGEDERELPDTHAGRAGMDETMLSRFRQFCDIAKKHHIKLVVAIMTVHMTGRHFVPPAMENRDIFTDPFALKWEMKFYDCFVRAMKDHPAIVAWETGNEMNYTAPVSSPEHAWVWTKMMHDIIRLADSSRPIVGVMAEGLDSSQHNWLIADQGELADYASVHRYDIQTPASDDGWLSLRNLYRAAAECRIISDIGGIPCFTEETGNWRNIALTLDGIGNAVNALLWNAWAEDSRAFLWWCAFDQERLDFAPYHWGDWPGLEHGVFDEEGAPHPAAKTMLRFGKMLKNAPLKSLPAMKADALCLVDDMECAFASEILAKQAGIHFRFQATRSPLEDAACYFLPSVKSRGGISSEDWRWLRERVRNGAVCYISADDCNLPGLREFCGMQIARRAAAAVPMRCVLEDTELTLKCHLQKEIQVETAEVLLRDNDGRVLLLRNRFGNGVVYTLTFSLEKILSDTPGGYDQPWWKIYRQVISKALLLESADSSVILTEHPIDEKHCAVVAVNCTDQEKDVPFSLASGWSIASQTGDAVPAEELRFRFTAGGGALFMLEKDCCMA